MSKKLEKIINFIWEISKSKNKNFIKLKYYNRIINSVIKKIDNGNLRIAEKKDNFWVIHEWIKKAILLFFQISKNTLIKIPNYSSFYDKIPLKFNNYNAEDFYKRNLRVVPSAFARYGSYISKNVILMPSYINIGSYIDSGTMIDTWSTIGSCAQIGKNVHISGGVGIGGVLEPIQDNPVIIEDNCFIGARSEIAEGVIIKENSVISMGVYISKSTKIYDRETGKISYGIIPSGSVIVPGNLPSNDNSHSIYCVVIVKKVDKKTREKVSINNLLREFS